jgi:hypothetical protein
MRPPHDSEIAVASGDGMTAYERARRVLRLGALANDEASAAVAAKLIVHLPDKPLRDPNAVSQQAITQAVLYLRKKYSEE